MIDIAQKYPIMARLREAHAAVQKAAVGVTFAHMVAEAEDVTWTRLNGAWEQMPGAPKGVLARVVRREEDTVFALEFTHPAGLTFPLHYHSATDERITVLKGTALLVIYNHDGEVQSEHMLKAGQSGYVKRGCPHAGYAQYGEDVHVLCEFSDGLRQCPEGDCQ